MTFIVTAICVQPFRKPSLDSSVFCVEPVEQGRDAWARAGYLGGLGRYFGEDLEGVGYYILTDEGDGYRTSNVLFAYGAGDEPARLVIPAAWRPEFEGLINELLDSSKESRVILVAEDNGHVTSPDLTAEEAEAVDVLGPVDPAGFWRLVDLGEVREDSVALITRNSRNLSSRGGW